MNHANQNWKPLAEDGEAGPLIKENTHQYSTRPDTERNSRVPEIGGRAESNQGRGGEKIHRFAPPPESRPAPGELLRPGRSPHEAPDVLTVALKRKRVNYVLDADIRGLSDHIDHGWMMKFVQDRVAESVSYGWSKKWPKSGVMKETSSFSMPMIASSASKTERKRTVL